MVAAKEVVWDLFGFDLIKCKALHCNLYLQYKPKIRGNYRWTWQQILCIFIRRGGGGQKDCGDPFDEHLVKEDDDTYFIMELQFFMLKK